MGTRDAGAWWPIEMAPATNSVPENITGETVSGDYFDALGVASQWGG